MCNISRYKGKGQAIVYVGTVASLHILPKEELSWSQKPSKKGYSTQGTPSLNLYDDPSTL